MWRTLLVSPDISLSHLHQLLQAAFGWEDRHFHEFRSGDQRWARPNPDFDSPGSVGHVRTRLIRALPVSGRLDYSYDFGDGWEHAVQLQGSEPAPWHTLPRCIAGAHSCPPEDCGGPRGYDELRRILADPSDPEHGAMRRWAGKKFDPTAFSLVSANRRVRRASAPSVQLARTRG